MDFISYADKDGFRKSSHIYCAHLFYCLQLVMQVVIYLLLYFKQKSYDGSLLPCANRKLLAQLQSSGENKQGSYTVFLNLKFSQ